MYLLQALHNKFHFLWYSAGKQKTIILAASSNLTLLLGKSFNCPMSNSPSAAAALDVV